MPGLGPELQPNPAEQINPILNQEIARPSEASPTIQSRPLETVAPPIASELNAGIAQPIEASATTTQPSETGLPSRDEIKSMDLDSLNEIQNAVFDHWAEK